MKEIFKREDINFFYILIYARDIFKNHFKDIIMAMLIVMIPVGMILGMINVLISNMNINFTAIFTDPNLYTQFLQSEEFSRIWMYYILSMAVQVLIVPLSTMAVCRIVKDAVYSKNTSYKDALIEAVSKAFPLIIGTLIYLVFVCLGLVFFVIPGIICIVQMYFYIQAVMLDNKGGWGSIKYSMSLVKGKFLKTLGFAFVIYMVNWSFSFSISTIIAMFISGYIGSVVSTAVSSIVSAFCSVCVAVLYINRQHVVYGPSENENNFIDINSL